LNVEEQLQQLDLAGESHLEIVELAGGVCRVTQT